MQATTTRQFGFNRFGTTIVALGIAVGVAIGAAVIDQLPSIGTGEQAIVLPKAHGSVNQGEGMLAGTSNVTAAVRAYASEEQGEGIVGGNLNVSAPAVNRYADYQFMEQNLNLPGRDIAPVNSPALDYRFIEMNLELPGTVPSAAPDWRVLEQNSWGEGFVLDGSSSDLTPPSATDVLQQRMPESSY